MIEVARLREQGSTQISGCRAIADGKAQLQGHPICGEVEAAQLAEGIGEASAGDQQRSAASVRAEYDTAKSIAGVAGAEAQIGLQIVVVELNADVIDSQLLAFRLNLLPVLASRVEPA